MWRDRCPVSAKERGRSEWPIAVLLRAGMASEDAAARRREHITDATGSLAEMIEAPDARLRIGLLRPC
jgi:hypothetical protein